MQETKAKIRLYLDASLAAGQPVSLNEGQAHYLFSVMRLVPGDPLLVFNGRDGEWLAQVAGSGKRAGVLTCVQLVGPQVSPPDLWLLFAPLKKARTDMLVEKAVELGVARIMPVLTRRTIAGRVRTDKLRAHATEAAEQCGATHVPEITAPTPLEACLRTWPKGRKLIFCDESRMATPMAQALATLPAHQPAAILIGPEGGFAPEEITRLKLMPAVLPVSLGPRILRAETAALAALVLWQATKGDWA